MIELFTAPTPNGHKVSILLEELGTAYRVVPVDISRGEQFRPDYVRLNPNARIPTIIDRDAGDFVVFESGAILVYLAEKFGCFLPREPQGRSRVLQWLMFQVGGVGPMQGQANVFFRYFPEKIQPAIDRYQKETSRLYSVLDARLRDHEYLAGDYSIADIATYPWVRIHNWAGVDVHELPHLRAWMERVRHRPAVQRGLEVPARISPEQVLESAQNIVIR